MNRNEIVQQQNEPETFGFKPDENVQQVTIRQLEQSIRVEGKHGRVLQTRPVQSWNVMAHILGLLTQANVNHTMEHVYVQKRNSFPMINDADKQLGYSRENCPINKWMFDKIVASFLIPNIGNDLVGGRIGMSFDENGIQIAFGMNVHVCSNFAIMGGQIMSTFKRGSNEPLSWQSVEIQLKDWVNNLDQNMKIEMDLMNKMIDTKIDDPAIIDRVIGGLYKRAIDQAYGSKALAPFDTAGMSNFTQNVLKASGGYTKDHVFDQEIGIRNVWDLYNYGTQVIKPGMVDIAEIQNSCFLFADHLFNEFEIIRN
jgi:hypothetical protein